MNANLEVVRTLAELREDRRPATAEEQAVIARWSAWGAQGVSAVFDAQDDQFAGERAELQKLLSDDEFAAARRTAVNAHFTDPAIVRELWAAMSDLGLQGGRVLEPGCGAGTFIGMAPSHVEMVGVELDPITARVAQALYPDATIRTESFAASRFPDASFDGVVGNVPFADVRLHEPRYNQLKLSMHNHFIVKSLDLVRPGGVVAVLTSRWTMDATNPAARRAMAERADLLGAVRLPSRMMARSAGTEAVIDVLVLRRREPDAEPSKIGWDHTVEVDLPGIPVDGDIARPRINEWFVAHPEMVLGEQQLRVGMHGVPGVEVVGDPAAAPAQLRERLASITADAVADGLSHAPIEAVATAAAQPMVLSSEVDGFIVETSGQQFTQAEEGQQVALKVPRTQSAELSALLQMRDGIRELLAAEAVSLEDTEELDKLRLQLRTQWQGYTRRWGPVNRFSVRQTGRVDPETGERRTSRVIPPAVRRFRTDPYSTLVRALEVFDESTQSATPSGILLERQVVPREPVRGVDDPAEAMWVCMESQGQVDVDEIAQLLGTDRGHAIEQLHGHIFEDPNEPNRWFPRSEYLSGNVRQKLALAQAAADEDPRWQHHVDELQAVLPEDLTPGEIHPKLGATWIPDTDVQQFVRELIDPNARIEHVDGTNWFVQVDRRRPEATKWGTAEVSVGDILKKMMSQGPVRVYDDDGVLLEKATTAAEEQRHVIQEEFEAWVWRDPDRSERLVRAYNDKFNSIRLRDYSDLGQALKFPGMTRTMELRDHQRTAVARMLSEKSVGLFHEVGAGKTAAMVAGTMELKRLGLVRKPAVVVPNHMLDQFTTEWLQLYPQAKLLAAGSEDLTADKRRMFIAKVATNQWDAVIMTRTAFQRLELAPETVNTFLATELETERTRLEEATARHGENSTIKQMEKQLMRREEDLARLVDVERDPGVTFEATGIDYLVVDELHDFKNLATTSEIQQARIPGAKRATDLLLKTSYLRATYGGRAITGATATPITNSIAEIHVMLRYLAPELLAERGMLDFDAWAATFCETETLMQMSVAGDRYEARQHLSRFNNVPELLVMFHQAGDVRTAAQLNLPRPEIAPRPSDGQRLPEIVVVPRTEAQAEVIRSLGVRAEAVRSRTVTPAEDNMLAICTAGRKAALDVRLLDPMRPSPPETPTKLTVAASRLAKVWEQTRDSTYVDPATGEESPRRGALQIVFCDMGTPSSKGGWNAYGELRRLLVERGIPQEQVRFVQDARTDNDKARLFAACRNGEVAVLIGSTATMGTGTNVQTRAVHLMDIDAPWRPADVTQRHGRALRQGNQNPELQISIMVTEDSFDTYSWQILERKAKFIDQIMTGHIASRSVEDIGGDNTLNFTEVKALSSGNPLLLDLAEAEKAERKLRMLDSAHRDSQFVLRRKLATDEIRRNGYLREIPAAQAAAAHTVDTTAEKFTMTINGHTTTKRAEAVAMLERVIGDREAGPQILGQLGGHDIEWSVTKEPEAGMLHTFALADVPEVRTQHLCPLGRQARYEIVGMGMLRSLENLPRALPRHIASLQEKLDATLSRIEKARPMIGQPSPHTADLEAAIARREEVQAQLAARHKENETGDAQSADTPVPVIVPGSVVPAGACIPGDTPVVDPGHVRPPAHHDGPDRNASGPEL